MNDYGLDLLQSGCYMSTVQIKFDCMIESNMNNNNDKLQLKNRVYKELWQIEQTWESQEDNIAE